MADDGAIAAVARRELGAAPDRVERLPDGDRHETYALDCGGGAYVLQFVADVAGRADDPARGLGLYRLLSDSGVPVPALVTDRPREFDGRTYTLVERLPGRSAETDVSPARARAAGRCLARIHDALAFDRPGWIGFERDDDGPAPVVRPFEAGGFAARVDRGIGRSVATLRAAGMAAAADAVKRLFAGAGDWVSGGFGPVVCHGDFSPDNLLFEGDALTGVLDFDRAYAGQAARDLAGAANAVWMHDPAPDWDPRAECVEGYRAGRDPGASFERVEPLYRVETLAKTVAGMADLGTLSEGERTFYDGRIARAVERAKRE